MADHSEHISKDPPSSEGEPRLSDAGADAIDHTDERDDAPGLGEYIGRAGVGAKTLARAIVSRSVAAGNLVTKPIGTTLSRLGGMLPSVTGKGTGGIGLFRGAIHSDREAVDRPSRVNRLEPRRPIWLRPVVPPSDSVGPVSGIAKYDAVGRRPGETRRQSSTERIKAFSTGDSSESSDKPRKSSKANARPIGRAAATRIRQRPETRSLRDLPTYVDSPARMHTERRIDGKLSRPVVSKSKWSPTEYESTKDQPPASLNSFLERNIAAPKENRLRPVSVSRRENSNTNSPLKQTAAEPTITDPFIDEDGTADAPESTSLNQVSVIHRDVAEPTGRSDKTTEVPDRRPRILQRSKFLLSRGRDAILRRRVAPNSTVEIRTEQPAAIANESPTGTADAGSSNARPRSTEVDISASNAIDVASDQVRPKGIVNRARELVFRKPSNETGIASDSDEAKILADAVQRRPDSRPISGPIRTDKTETVLARARKKLSRKPKTVSPEALVRDQQAPQETVKSNEVLNKRDVAGSVGNVASATRTCDADERSPASPNRQEIDNVSASRSFSSQPEVSSDDGADGTQASRLSQPEIEHRAGKHEPNNTAVSSGPGDIAGRTERPKPIRSAAMEHSAEKQVPADTAVPAEPRDMTKRVDRAKPVRHAEIEHRAETSITGGDDTSPTRLESDQNDRRPSLITQAARGIKLGAQRLVFRSVPSRSPSSEAAAPEEEPSNATLSKEPTHPRDASISDAVASREAVATSVLKRDRGATSAQKGIIHRKPAEDAPPDVAAGPADIARVPSSKTASARSLKRPNSATRIGLDLSTTRQIGKLGVLKSILSRKPSARRSGSEITSAPTTPPDLAPTQESSKVLTAPEMLHRQASDGPVMSAEQGDTRGQETLRSPLVRSSERPVLNSEGGLDVFHTMGDSKSNQPTRRPRNTFSHAPQVQRRIQPAATKAPVQRATAKTPMLNGRVGGNSGDFEPENALADLESGQNGAVPEPRSRKRGALIHKRESHAIALDGVQPGIAARPPKASRAADANVPPVQRASSAKEPSFSQYGAVRRRQMSGAPATAPGATNSQAPEQPTKPASAILDENEEPLYKKFTQTDIEFLGSKMLMYIKRKLNDDRERHGRPGFSMWS